MPQGVPPKRPDVQAEVRRLLDRGLYCETAHAMRRMRWRKVTPGHVKHVLRQGVRSEERDEYDEEEAAWEYVIEGSAPDYGRLRVVFSVKEAPPLPGTWVVVITAVDIR